MLFHISFNVLYVSSSFSHLNGIRLNNSFFEIASTSVGSLGKKSISFCYLNQLLIYRKQQRFEYALATIMPRLSLVAC